MDYGSRYLLSVGDVMAHPTILIHPEEYAEIIAEWREMATVSGDGWANEIADQITYRMAKRLSEKVGDAFDHIGFIKAAGVPYPSAFRWQNGA